MGRFVDQTLPGDPYGPRAKKRDRPYKAFVPTLLRDLSYTPSSAAMESVASASEVVAAMDARADGTPAKVSRLMGLLSRSEGIGSSTIENYSASMRRLVSDSAVDSDSHKLTSSRVILDGISAVEQGMDVLGDFSNKITPESIEQVQRHLMQHHPDHEHGYRSGYVQIGGSAGIPESADFLPPPANEVSALMDDLCDYINTDNGQHPIVRATIAHAQFETIHPFPDGNGRTGRVLFQAMLRREGLTANSALPISLSIVDSTERYLQVVKAMQGGDGSPSADSLDAAVSTMSDLTADAAARASRLIVAAESEREKMLAEVKENFRADSCAHGIADMLTQRLGVTVSQASEELGVDHDAVRLALEKMRNLDIVSARSASRSRVYFAHQLTNLLENSVDARMEDSDETPPALPALGGMSLGVVPIGRPRAGNRCGVPLRNGGVCMRAAGHTDGKHRRTP